MKIIPKFNLILEKYLDIDIIKERKMQYGDNFNDIAIIWNEEIDKTKSDNFNEQMVARFLAGLKKARIINQAKTLNKMTTGTDEYHLAWKKYEDSCTDYTNYMWISDNLKQYKEL